MRAAASGFETVKGTRTEGGEKFELRDVSEICKSNFEVFLDAVTGTFLYCMKF